MSMVHIAGSADTCITHLDKDMIAQNAIDIRVKSIRRILPTIFTIDEEQKIHRDTEEVVLDHDGYWTLTPGSYEAIGGHTIGMGETEAGFVITRSTLNRNGCFITSGNYDSGYTGSLAMCLHVNVGIMRIKPGTRIGQMLVWKAEALSQYNGDYGLNADGTPKAMEAKYHETGAGSSAA